jgi:hypothetical protein
VCEVSWQQGVVWGLQSAVRLCVALCQLSSRLSCVAAAAANCWTGVLRLLLLLTVICGVKPNCQCFTWRVVRAVIGASKPRACIKQQQCKVRHSS